MDQDLNSNKIDNRTKLEEFEYEVDRETRYVKNNKRFILYQFSYSEDDLKQDLWIEANKALRDYDPAKSNNVYNGERRIARRSTLVTKYLRKNVENKEFMCTNKKRKYQPIPCGLLLEACSNSMNVEEDIFAWDLLDAIHAKINDFQRAVLSLLIEDYSFREICRKVKAKPNMVQLAIDFIRDVTKSVSIVT